MNKTVVANMLKAASAAAVAAIALTTSPVEAGDVVEVSIAQMKFEPQQVRVKPGTTVKWVNHEKRTNHSILFEKEGVPESERLFPGESWSRTFDKPGTYPYTCGPHRDMSGVVEVAQ